jgi:hypothetical protein
MVISHNPDSDFLHILFVACGGTGVTFCDDLPTLVNRSSDQWTHSKLIIEVHSGSVLHCPIYQFPTLRPHAHCVQWLATQ